MPDYEAQQVRYLEQMLSWVSNCQAAMSNLYDTEPNEDLLEHLWGIHDQLHSLHKSVMSALHRADEFWRECDRTPPDEGGNDGQS